MKQKSSPSPKPLEIYNPRSFATLVAYASYFVFGVLVGPGPYSSLSVASAIPSWAENVWSYSMFVGGFLYLVGATLKNKSRYWTLTFQTAGSSGVFFGLLTYGIASFIRAGYPNGLPLFVVLMGLALASGARAISCYLDTKKLERAVLDERTTVEVVAEPSKAHGDHS